MTKYIVNSVDNVKCNGTFEYRPISFNEAKKWVERPFESFLHYHEVADAFATVFDIHASPAKRKVELEVGDEALIFRINKVLMAYMNEPGFGIYVDKEFIEKNYEIAFLKRIK